MMRRPATLMAAVGLVLACTVDDAGDDTGGSFGVGGPTTAMDAGDDMSDTGEDDSGTTGDTGTTGTDTGTTSDTGSTSDSGSETGGFVPPNDDDGGGDGAYAPCPGGMCPNGDACLQGEGPNEGKSYCAPLCNGNPANCPDPPEGDAVPICIDVNDGMGGANTSYCALDCTGGKMCPAGQTCVNETDANGPIMICL